MNPLTNIKNQQKLNQTELALGLTGKKSWHDQYKDSAWIFVGGLPFDLTEGDILCVFSQYGEIVNINLVRDQKSGKSKGFCFICYEDQRSTILTVDNLNGIKILGRMIRVDHVEDYKKPKEHGNEDEVTMKLRAEGCAPKVPDSPEEMSSEEEPLQVKVKVKIEKKLKVKKEKKSKKKKKRQSSSSNDELDSDSEEKFDKVKVKKERFDPGYDKALNVGRDKYSSKRSYSPPERTEGKKYSKYSKDFQDSGKNRSRGYDYTERNHDRDNRGGRRYENSYDDQHRDRDYKKNRNNDRDYMDRDSSRGFNKELRNSERHYEGGRDGRDFERNRDNRDYERKHMSRDSGSCRERKNYDEMERSYHNRDERVYDKKDSHRRDRRENHSENY